MNISKGKALVASLIAVMMALMAVPSVVSAIPTAGDEVTRVTLDESKLFGLRIEYRDYDHPEGFLADWAWGAAPGAWAGQMNVTVSDTESPRYLEEYTAFCLDFYKPIQGGDILEIDHTLYDSDLNDTEALIVNYILAMYEASDDLSGAAIQCAIWYFLTAEFGTYDDMMTDLATIPSPTKADVQYQFMTDPYPAARYDAMIFGGGSALRLAAQAIIEDVEAANVGPEPLKYPYSISITPPTQTMDVGDMAYLTIEVRDQYDDPFEGAIVHQKAWWDIYPTPTEYYGPTDSNGQIVWWALASMEVTFYLSACVNGSEAFWVFDSTEPMDRQSLVIPNKVCDEANVVWEQECYYPDGHTPGFWKNNAKKYLEWQDGIKKKYVGYQVHFEDYEDYLDAITAWMDPPVPANWEWLVFDEGNAYGKLAHAYDILSYGGSDPMLKAQKHMLSALLTWQWYAGQGDGDWYLDGCLEGYGMTIEEAIGEMMMAYDMGDYEWAHELAGALNEQGDS